MIKMNCSHHIMIFMVVIAVVLFERSVIDVDSLVFRRACRTHSASRQSFNMLHRCWYDCDRLFRRRPHVIALGMPLQYDDTDTVSARDGAAATYDSSYSSLYVLPNSPVSLSSTVGFLQHWGREQADTGSAITAEVRSCWTISCGS